MLIRIAMYQPFGLSSGWLLFTFLRIQKEGGNIEDKKVDDKPMVIHTKKKLRFICMNRRKLKLRAVTFTLYSVVRKLLVQR